MKKNKMMRTASVLLVLTLLTVCVISGTFAKYVVSDNGSDSARVAKFGVTVTANGKTFSKAYATDDQSVKGIAESVVSTEDVVAPGTTGSTTAMTVSGTPEVAVKVDYKGEFALNDKWTVDGAFYCPLTITVGTDTITGTDYTSAKEFVDAVNAKIDGYSATYGPNTDLSKTLPISWAWAYEGDNAKDTKLGDQAADGNAGTVTLKVTTTVTQID